MRLKAAGKAMVAACAVGMSVLAATIGGALAQSGGDPAHGRDVVERSCLGCHAISGEKDKVVVQGVDVPSFRTIAARPGRTPERLESLILSPHAPMPTLPLSAREVRDVVAFISSLR